MNGPACAGCPLPKLLDYKPERLVVSGFRCCMAGYEFGDIEVLGDRLALLCRRDRQRRSAALDGRTAILGALGAR